MTLPTQKYNLLRLNMRGVMSGNGYQPAPNMSEQDLNDFVSQLATDGSVGGTPVPPVRSVQVTALPSYVATTTMLMALANGALSPAVFGLTTLAAGDRLEKGNLGVAAADNGLYAVAQLGSVSTPWILTRTTELDSSLELSAGATYTVLEGGSANSARYLAIPGPITVGVTPFAFAAAREQPLIHKDLTKAPWGIQSFETSALAYAALVAGTIQNADAIERFCEFCKTNGNWNGPDVNIGSYVGILPNGVIPLERRIFTTGSFCVEGVSRAATLFGQALQTGPAWWNGAVDYPTLTAISGLPAIGSSAGAVPLATGKLTFSGSSVTREFGSFIADGFAAAQIVAIHYSASNNTTGKTILSLTASTLTFTTTVVSEVARNAGIYNAVDPSIIYADGAARLYDITQTANVHWRCDTGTGADTVFEWRGTVVPYNRPSDSMVGHIVSTKGFHQDTHINPDVMHSIGLYDLSAGHSAPVAVLRTIDNNNLRQTAGAVSHAVSLSGGTVPDGIPVNVEIVDPGANGTGTFRYYDDLGWHLVGNPSPLAGDSTGTLHTIPAAGTPYALHGCISSTGSPTYINFPSGTYGADERYSTVQTTTLSSTTAMASDGATMYEIAHVYDGTKTTLAVNNLTAGTADPAGASAVHAAQTGKVVSYAYESTVVGDENNFSIWGSAIDGWSAAPVFLLGHQFSNTTTAAVAVPSPYPRFGSDNKYWFIPYLSGAAAQYGHDGKLKCWFTESKFCTIAVTGSQNGLYTSNAHLSRVTYDSGQSASGFMTWFYNNRSTLRDFAVSGSGNGFLDYQGFFNTVEEWEINNSGLYGIAFNSGGLNAGGGNNRITGAMKLPLVLHNSSAYIGGLFIDAEGYPYSQIWGITVQGFKANALNLSAESSFSINSGGMPGGMVSVSALSGSRLEFHGTLAAASDSTRPLTFAPSANNEGGILWDMYGGVNSDREIDYLRSDYAMLTAPIVELGPTWRRSPGTLQLSNRPELCLKAADMPVDDPVILGDASVTILRTAGSYFRLPPNTLTANRTLTLGDGAAHGQVQRISVRAQATYTYTILDGSTHKRLGIQSLAFNYGSSGTAGILRSATGGLPVGSWLAEGFAVGDAVKIRYSVSNNGAYTVTAVTATILTLDRTLVTETITTNVEIVGTPATFPTLATVTAGQTLSSLFRRDVNWELMS